MTKKSSKGTPAPRIPAFFKEQRFRHGPPPGVDDAKVNEIMAPFEKRVALIATHWGVFEISMDQLIWSLAGVNPKKGACITAQFGSTYLRLRAITALLQLRPKSEKLLKKLNSFGGEMEGVVRQRNRAIHDPIGIDPNTLTPFNYRITADKKLDHGVAPINLEDYDDILHRIINLRIKFEDLSKAIIGHCSSADKHH